MKLFKFDYESPTVTFGISTVVLPKIEFLILHHLYCYYGRTVDREILHAEFANERSKKTETINSHVAHLRRRLKALTQGEVQIHCVYKIGYILIDCPSDEQSLKADALNLEKK